MIKTPVKISRKLTVGPQPSKEQLEKLSKKGFKTIVNLCKKGELNQHFKPVEEGEVVEQLGMEYVHVPMSLSSLKDAHIEQFCDALEGAPTPAYVHCRIGQRSGPLSLIFHALRKKMSADQVLEKGKKLGLEWQAPMITDIIRRYLKTKVEVPA